MKHVVPFALLCLALGGVACGGGGIDIYHPDGAGGIDITGYGPLVFKPGATPDR